MTNYIPHSKFSLTALSLTRFIYLKFGEWKKSHYHRRAWLIETSPSSKSSSIDSTKTSYRYAAYANRIRTILLSAHRYIAYTSDVGESFRPVAHPWLVRSAYAISWSYILGDVGHEGYKAYLRNRRALIPPGEAYKDATDLKANNVVLGMATGNIAGPLSSSTESRDVSHDGDKSDILVPWATTQIPLIDDYRMVMAKRAVFQSLASMGLPAFTIHSVVRYSGRALKNTKNSLIRTWGPIGVSIPKDLVRLKYLSDSFQFCSWA